MFGKGIGTPQQSNLRRIVAAAAVLPAVAMCSAACTAHHPLSSQALWDETDRRVALERILGDIQCLSPVEFHGDPSFPDDMTGIDCLEAEPYSVRVYATAISPNYLAEDWLPAITAGRAVGISDHVLIAGQLDFVRESSNRMPGMQVVEYGTTRLPTPRKPESLENMCSCMVFVGIGITQYVQDDSTYLITLAAVDGGDDSAREYVESLDQSILESVRSAIEVEDRVRLQAALGDAAPTTIDYCGRV